MPRSPVSRQARPFRLRSLLPRPGVAAFRPLWRSPPRRRATYHLPPAQIAAWTGIGAGRLRPEQVGVAASSRIEYIVFCRRSVGAEEKMVRTVADRAFLPAKSLFEQVGNMLILTGKTITATVRPPYPYGGEFISQFIFALQLCWFPMLISTVAFGFGAPGLQAANFLTLFGALDRLGGFFVLASIREFAPFVTAVVVAGVAGTAITRCYKAMTASGGAAGAGRAVNEAVVIAFLGVFAFTYVSPQTLLATHPEIQVIK